MQEKKSFGFSTITHDLKSPMIGILGLSRLMGKEMLEEEANPKWIEFSNRIHSSGEQIIKLIEGILTMAKIEAGEEKIEPYRIDDLEEQMKSILTTFELEANTKKISLQLKVVEPLGCVFWDMLRIRLHIINNLISNALKFTPDGGIVTLSVRKINSHLQIKVEDTGPGIPEDDLENIFHAYEQVCVSSHRISEGAGLGLSNARLFTEKHRGRIFAQNRGRKSGASFLVCLPINTSDPYQLHSFSNIKEEKEVHNLSVDSTTLD